mmetsp:Transcript_14502/g.29335  ORF Transcript_14502/g.29335 Transcript_14502/m.29335 type:complete len:461 (-) Transcript_14502:12-1394(-)|eukprot:scaffold287_cov173-Amphora_coffeaeformis.AAC.22
MHHYFIYVLELQQGKIYVGRSDVLMRSQEIWEYHTKSDHGPPWTKLFGPPKSGLERIESNDLADVDKKVKEYMAKYGIDNVRGGSFHEIELMPAVEDRLHMELQNAPATISTTTPTMTTSTQVRATVMDGQHQSPIVSREDPATQVSPPCNGQHIDAMPSAPFHNCQPNNAAPSPAYPFGCQPSQKQQQEQANNANNSIIMQSQNPFGSELSRCSSSLGGGQPLFGQQCPATVPHYGEYQASLSQTSALPQFAVNVHTPVVKAPGQLNSQSQQPHLSAIISPDNPFLNANVAARGNSHNEAFAAGVQAGLNAAAATGVGQQQKQHKNKQQQRGGNTRSSSALRNPYKKSKRFNRGFGVVSPAHPREPAIHLFPGGSPTFSTGRDECFRCGRPGHKTSQCFAHTDVDGCCIRCGRSSHGTNTCFANTDINGHCCRCGRSSHGADTCFASTHANGSYLGSSS